MNEGYTMFNSMFNQSEIEVAKSIQIKDNDQLIQSKFVMETLIQQSQSVRRMGLTDLLNSINARSAKR